MIGSDSDRKAQALDEIEQQPSFEHQAFLKKAKFHVISDNGRLDFRFEMGTSDDWKVADYYLRLPRTLVGKNPDFRT